MNGIIRTPTTARGAGTVIDGAGYSTAGTASYPFAGYLSHGDQGTAPAAYLNYYLFDRNFVPKTGGFKRITTNARETGDLANHTGLDYEGAAHERVAFDGADEILITEPGFVYIWLSNEETTPVEVYFDDLKVTHTKSPVVQTDDYYPFGLTFNSYSRENSVPNRWKFQGQEHLDDLGLNWDQFKWRNHQPEIGRFFNIDPLASKYVFNSPYAFSENKVVAHVELEGLESVESQALQNEIKKVENVVMPVVNDVIDFFSNILNFQPDMKFKAVNENQSDPLGKGDLDYGENPEALFNPHEEVKIDQDNTAPDIIVTNGGQRKGSGEKYDEQKNVKEVTSDHSNTTDTINTYKYFGARHDSTVDIGFVIRQGNDTVYSYDHSENNITGQQSKKLPKGTDQKPRKQQ